MGFYIRKSIKAGPFRFNLSKSGVGLSVGVRGFRLGAGPRGNYVRAGVGGFYYAQTLSASRTKRSDNVYDRSLYQPKPPSAPDLNIIVDGIQMEEIGSTNIESMQDSSAKHILEQIQINHKKVRLSYVISLVFLIAAFGTFRISHTFAYTFFVLSIFGNILGRWIDSYRRTTVIYYDFESRVLEYYEQFVAAFNKISSCKRVWHLTSAGKIYGYAQQKRNAGATMAITRNQFKPTFGLPVVIKSNIVVPMLPLGKKTLYFFPDFLLVVDGKNVGGVNYENLTTQIQATRFIETESVPSDTQVLDKTWKHPNKNGGPDKRFSNNRQYPICAYESILFETTTGVKELIEYSKRGQGQSLHEAIDYLCFANDPASKNA